MKLGFSRHIFEKKAQISSFIKIRPVGAELFHVDGSTDRRTDGHDEANSRFSQFCERASKYRPVLLTAGTSLCSRLLWQQTIIARCKFQHAYLNALSERWNVSGAKDRCKLALHIMPTRLQTRVYRYVPKLLNFLTPSLQFNLAAHISKIRFDY